MQPMINHKHLHGMSEDDLVTWHLTVWKNNSTTLKLGRQSLFTHTNCRIETNQLKRQWQRIFVLQTGRVKCTSSIYTTDNKCWVPDRCRSSAARRSASSSSSFSRWLSHLAVLSWSLNAASAFLCWHSMSSNSCSLRNYITHAVHTFNSYKN